MTKTREPQYESCFDVRPVTLGPMSSHTYRHDPRRLGFVLSRYKFVAKMMSGFMRVAEIGCGDGFASEVVRQEVQSLMLFDFDKIWGHPYHDIVEGVVPHDPFSKYDGIYMLDVLEHIEPLDECAALINIVKSLRTGGVFICGMPSLESQPHVSEQSKAGHVNCKTLEGLRETMKAHFQNVFMLAMNDEVLHTGFGPMCHYLLAVCTGPKQVHIMPPSIDAETALTRPMGPRS